MSWRLRTSSVMQTINDWEEIPGIDKVIENAKRHSVAASPAARLWLRASRGASKRHTT